MSDFEKLSVKEKVGYALGDTASNFFFQVFGIFLLFYYTDIFGLAPAAVGMMFLVTKVVDAVSDPLIGLIADRTNSRWGKFRPYILFGAIPYGICGYLMFASPDLSESGKLIYAYVTYSAMMLIYTLVNVPYSALMGVISPSSIERTKVASYRFIGAFSAGWIVGTFVTPLKNILGGGDEVLGFKITMGIFAVISVVLFWVTFATTKERVKPVVETNTFRSDFKFLLQNGPWMVAFAAGVFTLMNVALRNGGILYYFKYYVGDDGSPLFLIFDKTAVFMSLGLMSMIVGIALTSKLAERFEKRNLFITVTILNAISMAAFYVIPPDEYWLMVLVNCLGSFVIGPQPALVWSMYADTADYGEYKTGRRTTALVFSTLQFAQKFGLAVGAGLAGLILGWFGFIANETQSPESLNGIRILFSLLPALFAILSAIAIMFYKIDSKLIQTMEVELEARRQKAIQG